MPRVAKAPRHLRGYGLGHFRLRAQLKPVVAAGLVKCSRCGELIEPGAAWDLDHRDDRSGYAGPAHASCNRRAGGGARTGRRWSRRW